MTKHSHSDYTSLFNLSKNATLLESTYNLLEWDQETYMPKEAIEHRSEQLELMASLIHDERTSPKYKEALSKLIDLETGVIKNTSLTKEESAAVREWRRDYLKTSKLPMEFVKEFAKTTSQALHVWAEAKRHSNFHDFAPHLEKIVELNKRKAEYLGYKKHPYDALLDLYEPEVTTDILTPLFGKMKIDLSNLLRSIQIQPKHSREFLHQEFNPSEQMHFGKMMLKELGFSDGMSRLDLSSHPFCNALHPKDVRMTTRIIPNLPLSNIFSVIHEAGHGIYEAQLDTDKYGSPLGSAISLGIHESQSRLWETIIGKSLSFWKHFYPLLQKSFPSQLKAVSLDEFYLAINHVEPSLIRVEADEVTYCLHVILRYELEKALIEGSLQVKDLPFAWNEKIREYLGISPTTDSEGCLQDIHWSMGAFGYFPTYALGNLYAAQIFNAFEGKHPEWKEKIASGQFALLRKWLEDHLHKHGRFFTPTEAVEHITGHKLTEAAYIEHLQKKYKKIFRF